jgi:hypothetical protein
LAHDYYVYIYFDPRSNQPFYVGKGRKKRMFDHLKETAETTQNPHKFYKIQKIREETGFDPPITVVHSGLSNDNACKLEMELIEKYGRESNSTGILTNLTDGGDRGCPGYKHTEQDKRKMSEKWKGIPLKERKCYDAIIAHNKSEEGRRKNSEANKGKKLTDEDKRKKSLAAIGNTRTKGTKWYFNPETGDTTMIYPDQEIPNGYIKGRGNLHKSNPNPQSIPTILNLQPLTN